jgi:hypothetical protein
MIPPPPHFSWVGSAVRICGHLDVVTERVGMGIYTIIAFSTGLEVDLDFGHG